MCIRDSVSIFLSEEGCRGFPGKEETEEKSPQKKSRFLKREKKKEEMYQKENFS
jgi:hypothetical protein